VTRLGDGERLEQPRFDGADGDSSGNHAEGDTVEEVRSDERNSMASCGARAKMRRSIRARLPCRT
jgi:hypothetical protein